MNQQVLETAAVLLGCPSLTGLDRDLILGVYKYLEVGKHDSAFMRSLKAQAELTGSLSPTQLLKAAHILRGRFKHYLEETGQEVQYRSDGTLTLGPVAEEAPARPIAVYPAPRPIRPAKPAARRRPVLAAEAG